MLLSINSGCTPKALLVLPTTAANGANVFKNYLQKLGTAGKHIQVMAVEVPKKGRMSKDKYLPILEDLLEYRDLTGVNTIITPIAELIRNLQNSSKQFALERSIGKVIVTDEFNIIPTINYQVLKFSPSKKNLLSKSLNIVDIFIKGEYKDDTNEVINSLNIKHIKSIADAKKELQQLLNQEALSVDIETTGLKWFKDKLLTISFSKSDKEAVVFTFSILGDKLFTLLKNFFIAYKGKVIAHNATFDIAFLVYNLFMKDLDDHEGMINGVNQFDLDDTMIMAWLCLNSTEKAKLDLKELAFERFGAYDDNIDQKNLVNTDIEEVVKYNGIDTIATMYIYNKFKTKLIEEEQDKLYEEYYRPVLKTMLKVKMTGICLDEDKVNEAYDTLDKLVMEDTNKLQTYPAVQDVIQELKYHKCEKYNSKAVKQKTPEDFEVVFNPNSPTHKRLLLFDALLLNSTKTTSTGQLSTDKEVLRDLYNSSNGEAKEVIGLLIEIAQASIVRNNFLKAFKELSIKTDRGDLKLYGEYNITGTLSGRLSSKSPNLQNMPSTGSKYAKLIKECIIPIKGFAIFGSDYSSCEDRVMASLANCKNKIKEYIDGVDGHCLRAANYFKEELESRGIHIDMDNVEEVNKLKQLAPDLRQDSKAPTFAMAYGGLEAPVQNALKCSKTKAKEIVQAYKKLYPELDEFAEDTYDFAIQNGYIKGFFGLKLRCPNLKAEDKSVKSSTLRTLVNMRIQSSAMLTVKAMTDFQEMLERDGMHNDIRLYATIHDSIYGYFRPTLKVLKYIYINLLDCMLQPYEGQIVPNEADLDIGVSWANLKTIHPPITDELLEELR